MKPDGAILQMLAIRYMRAGLLDLVYVDKDYPYKNSRSFTCVYWNFGNWQRSRFAQNLLLERLGKYRIHINFVLDFEHKFIGDRPLEVQKIGGYRDCCMGAFLKKGPARNEFTEDVNDFEFEDHVGKVW